MALRVGFLAKTGRGSWATGASLRTPSGFFRGACRASVSHWPGSSADDPRDVTIGSRFDPAFFSVLFPFSSLLTAKADRSVVDGGLAAGPVWSVSPANEADPQYRYIPAQALQRRTLEDDCFLEPVFASILRKVFTFPL